MNESVKKPEIENPLGIDTTNLGSVKLKDLMNNKVAANMVLNYTRNCEGRISELEIENETLRTYANNYENGRTKNNISFVLNLIGTIFIGFAINLLTNNQPEKEIGWLLLFAGLVLQLIAGYYLIRR